MSREAFASRRATVTSCGDAPTASEAPAPNVPSPLLRKTVASFEAMLTTTMSSRPSALKSAAAMAVC
jgi:hypothetical protein